MFTKGKRMEISNLFLLNSFRHVRNYIQEAKVSLRLTY